MKKIIRILFLAALPIAVTYGVWSYYESLPIRGPYVAGSVDYPQINKDKLKEQLAAYSKDELLQMYTAGLEATKWQNLLSKVHETVFSDVIKNFDNFFIGDRYPHDSINDFETQSTYFYHSHRPREHGHFHVYYSNEDVMSEYEVIASWNRKHLNTHIVAISMHPDGDAIGFFVPNQWITKDEWFKAEDMEKMISNFEINHPYPSWPSNQWVKQMLIVFKPQLIQVLKERDKFIFNRDVPMEKTLNDPKIDVLASISISISDQMEVLGELLKENLDQKTD